ncbi:MAG: patatin-like phospholipase family protein [Chloroflexota bacterium]
MPSKLIKVLSIDGGGIRAIIPALILDYIEKQSGRYTADMFDLVAGTSSGGIVALGLTYPGIRGRERFRAVELADLFFEEGENIFKARFGAVRQLVDEKYPHEHMERVLKQYFGDTRLGEAVKGTLITSYDVASAHPRFFRSRLDDTDGEIEMWKVARATTAAPTFFEPFKLELPHRTEALIDGGMIANNPAMVALTEVTHYIEDYAVTDRFDDDVLVVSLGTGRLNNYFTFDEIKDWGALEWARPAIEITITGGVEAVHQQMEEVLRAADARYYYRFQTDVPDSNRAMDDTTPENLVLVRQLAEQIIEDNRAELDELIAKLVD